jgi:lysophospholipase L1-like esterase
VRGKGIMWFMWVSGLSCALWVVALGWTMANHMGLVQGGTPAPSSPAIALIEPQPVTAAADDGKLQVVSLGDSLARGTGDATGKGYVGVAAELMKARAGEREVSVTNLGVNGFTSSQLSEQIKRADVQATIRQADVLLVSIGGNDLFRGGETLAQLDLTKVKELETEYNQRLKSLLTEIRELNPSANVYLIGLYNPFNGQKNSEITNGIVRDWNYQLSVTAADIPKTVIVPTFDLFQLRVQDYLAADLFHPNAEGYKRIGERLGAIVVWEG